MALMPLPTRVSCTEPAYSLEQHGKIGIHAQRHDLSVDGGASLGEVGNTASGLKALHQHSWMNQAREEAGHSHLDVEVMTIKDEDRLTL
eukprot:1153961-Pelagomonas_calceolata.AAC.7